MSREKKQSQPTHSNFWALLYIWGIILSILAGIGLLFWERLYILFE